MRLCGFFMGVLVSFSVSAQTHITGMVVDKASGLPIEYASIVLIKLYSNTAVKATATDKKGKYNFADVDSGSYRIQCSFVGYDKTE